MTLERIFETIMEQRGIAVSRIPVLKSGPVHLGIRMGGDGVEFEGYAVCFEEERLFLFYAALGIKCDESRRPEVLALLAGINLKMKIGAFYMDPADGEITFRLTQYICGEDELCRKLMEMLITMAGMAAEKYRGDFFPFAADKEA